MNHTFDYEIQTTHISEYLPCHIPGMLVQPYIENAIKYGLGLLQDFNDQYPNQKRHGHLSVSFSHSLWDGKDSIICVIEDNGVGRKYAYEEYSSHSSHQGLSRSTRINEQRLELLHNLNMQIQHVHYEDIIASDGAICGTRVTLHIPIIPHPHL
jgi:two-component system, LytTR family, sensor kinase